MAKYKVTVHYKGSIDLGVDADNENEALKTAEKEFDNVSDMELVGNLYDISTNRFCVTEEEDAEDT